MNKFNTTNSLYLININLKGISEDIIVLKYNIFSNKWISEDGLCEITETDENYSSGWNIFEGRIKYLSQNFNEVQLILTSLKLYSKFYEENLSN